jgi:hypothetical protein
MPCTSGFMLVKAPLLCECQAGWDPGLAWTDMEKIPCPHWVLNPGSPCSQQVATSITLYQSLNVARTPPKMFSTNCRAMYSVHQHKTKIKPVASYNKLQVPCIVAELLPPLKSWIILCLYFIKYSHEKMIQIRITYLDETVFYITFLYRAISEKINSMWPFLWHMFYTWVLLVQIKTNNTLHILLYIQNTIFNQNRISGLWERTCRFSDVVSSLHFQILIYKIILYWEH